MIIKKSEDYSFSRKSLNKKSPTVFIGIDFSQEKGTNTLSYIVIQNNNGIYFIL